MKKISKTKREALLRAMKSHHVHHNLDNDAPLPWTGAFLHTFQLCPAMLTLQASTEDYREALTGLWLSGAHAYASDGRRLMRWDAPEHEGHPDTFIPYALMMLNPRGVVEIRDAAVTVSTPGTASSTILTHLRSDMPTMPGFRGIIPTPTDYSEGHEIEFNLPLSDDRFADFWSLDSCGLDTMGMTVSVEPFGHLPVPDRQAEALITVHSLAPGGLCFAPRLFAPLFKLGFKRWHVHNEGGPMMASKDGLYCLVMPCRYETARHVPEVATAA